MKPWRIIERRMVPIALWLLLLLLLLLVMETCLCSAIPTSATAVVEYQYGVDVSFPIHHANVSTNYAYLRHNLLPSLYPKPHGFEDMPIQPLGNRQAVYDEYMKGCEETYSRGNGRTCRECEQERIEMNLRQPQSMINYTQTVRIFCTVYYVHACPLERLILCSCSFPNFF